ncbi:phosphoribosylamine--glycine ligase [Geosporobacter ferrireducens]|uniref:Phosphoribosylamine--glycine ligase n=1 Tax=Geosporobacter ferrireducens TaxID=1424294 RepID=A0A1D8GG56_9FIRM|nr:phosphoribosylamine--glycine ligase [Geosporobacter ferrireducens]AOT69881.1 phosphoribosylamine--glycine ligase [Geosporobacter ferrireducens]MTI54424.1 phosphoribosylamine--glycine ligase [Geosporobacter ferrireducens]
MKVLVIGSGGREHALVWKLKKSPKVDNIYCAPGNAGIGTLAELVDIPAEAAEALCAFAKEKQIDLTIVGPEGPLVMGIVDRFEKEGLKVFGPNWQCAQLEGSKAFAKDFMKRHQIPTARYEEYTDLEAAKNAVGIYGYPMVIKADGLAAGKGVVIAQDEKEALEALEQMMAEKKFGAAGDKIVIEEFLEGIETSILCFVDGKTIVPMVSAQDYKRIFDGDQGPNTGGMGTYSPSHIYDEKLERTVAETILTPIIDGFKKDRLDFKGVLFIGLMITQEGPRVLEFNTRFGDPETQVILTRLESDLVEIIESILEGKLAEQKIQWSQQGTVCVVLAAGGYPESYEKGKPIRGLGAIDPDAVVFHAGTKQLGQEVVTHGGRVLGVTAWGDTVEAARKKAYENIEKITFEKMQYRKDIGKSIQ